MLVFHPLHKLRIINVYKETISDGDGLRYSIYLSGCSHACIGCHNQSSWDPNTGTVITEDILDSIVEQINSNPLLDGITVSGGDPFFYPDALFHLLKILKDRTGLNIWCYTGYVIEQLERSSILSAPLQYIDVLVDGRFIQEKFDPSLTFRGSSNQRIIDLNQRRKERGL